MDVAARFGDNVKKQRKLADLSQDELSYRASLHRTEVSQIERGLRLCRVDTVAKLAGAMGIDAGKLFEGSAGNRETFATASSSPTRTLRSEHG
jgi:transcriptional regulator with XRE-family HTH domain